MLQHRSPWSQQLPTVVQQAAVVVYVANGFAHQVPTLKGQVEPGGEVGPVVGVVVVTGCDGVLASAVRVWLLRGEHIQEE